MANEKYQNTIANPAPLGLLGFGMTTLLLNLHNAGIIGLSIVIVAMDLLWEVLHKSLLASWNSRRTMSSVQLHSLRMGSFGGL